MKALRITVEGRVSPVELAEDSMTRLSQMQAAVGGWVEAVDMTDTLTMWVDEEGKLAGKPINPVANQVVGSYRVGLMPGDFIVGDVLLTGFDQDSGEVTPLPVYAVELITLIAPGCPV